MEGDDFWILGRPFMLSFDSNEPVTEEVSTVLGWSPQEAVVLAAMCNDRLDHRLLGELCLHFARQLEGWIDFGGALLPRLSDSVRVWYESRDSSTSPGWEEWEPHVRRMIDGLPGTLHTVLYSTEWGKEWGSHIGDADFLEAWLRHRDFHMVK